MGTSTSRRKVILAGVVVCGGFAACYWFFDREREAAYLANSPSCQIRILSRPERLAPPSRLPAEQADNPVLFADQYAKVRFKNATNRFLTVYAFSFFPEWEPEPSVRHAFIVDVEVRGAHGSVLDDSYPPHDVLQSIVPPKVPPAAELLARNPPTFTLRPGEGIDLPISILGKVRNRQRGLKSGTYTVRATVSYAEAPNGETKRVTSEPVTVTVTEEDIKATEAYWASLKNR